MSQQQPQEPVIQETVYWIKKRKDAAGGMAFLTIVLILIYALTARFIGLVGLIILLLLLALFWWAVFSRKNPYYTEQEKAPFQLQDDKPLSIRIQEQEELAKQLKQSASLLTSLNKAQQVVSTPLSVPFPLTPQEGIRQQSEQSPQGKTQEQLLLSASRGYLPEPKQENKPAPIAASEPTPSEERKVDRLMGKLTMKCSQCKGIGTLYNDCPHCDGGYPAWNSYPLVVRAQYLAPCTICSGSGHINPHPCDNCGGTGKVIRQAYAPGENILIPRFMFALLVVLTPIIINMSQTPSDGTSIVPVNPMLVYTRAGIGILELILLFTPWIWCLYLTYKRDQSIWRTWLWLAVFCAAIPVLLYLLLNPQYEQED